MVFNTNLKENGLKKIKPENAPICFPLSSPIVSLVKIVGAYGTCMGLSVV